LTAIDFPKGVATIGGSAFRNCSSLQVIWFPRRIQVGSYAFGNCSMLSRILLTDQIAGVATERNAFHKCPKLFHVEIANPNKTTIAITPAEISLLEELLSCPDISTLTRACVDKPTCVFAFFTANIQRIV